MELSTLDQADVTEVNHYFDQNGKLVLEQVIWWEWSDLESRYQVRDWRLLKSKAVFRNRKLTYFHPIRRPQFDHRRDEYVMAWKDGEQYRIVRSVSMRETWTFYDPEVADRERLPRSDRRKLK